MKDGNPHLEAQLDTLLSRFMHMDHGGKEEADEITDLLVTTAAFPVGEMLRRDIHLFAQTILHDLDASLIGLEGAKRRIIAAAGEAKLGPKPFALAIRDRDWSEVRALKD